MASGELYLSIFPDYLMLELFKQRGKTKTLVKKHYEKLSLPLERLKKLDVIGFEKTLASFLAKSTVKKGRVRIAVFGDSNVVRYEELDLGTDKVRDMKNLLPFEIDALGDSVKGFKYRHEFIGTTARLHLMREEVVTTLSSLALPKSWEIECLLPGYMVNAGIAGDSGILVDPGATTFSMYTYVNGVLKSFETNLTHKTSYDPTRPENPDIEYLISTIDNDVTDFFNIQTLEFKDALYDLNTVTVLRNGNSDGSFGEIESGDMVYVEHRDAEGIFLLDGGKKGERYEVSSVVLGIHALEKSLLKYDFSPEKLGIAYKQLLISSLTFSLLLGAGLPGVSYWTGKQLETRADEVAGYQQTLVTYEGNVTDLKAQIKTLDKTIDDYNAYVSSLERLNNVDRNFVSKLLGYLPDNTPSSIYVESVSLTKGTKNLVVKGLSNNYKDIGAFAIQLEQFGTVRINDIENNELLNMDGYPFELELKSR